MTEQMTNSPTRVSSYENRRVSGLALCADQVFEDKIEEATELRKRQADYLASLPQDAEEVIATARARLEDDYGVFVKALEAAEHQSVALTCVLGQMFDGEALYPDQKAAEYLSMQVEDAVRTCKHEIKAALDVLRNPARIEREASEEVTGEILYLYAQMDEAYKEKLMKKLKAEVEQYAQSQKSEQEASAGQ